MSSNDVDERLAQILGDASRNYFRRDGTPYRTLDEWAKDFEIWPGQRRVAHTHLWWGGDVSTVWLGLNHNFDHVGPPIIFETIVFAPYSFQSLEMRRYSTEAQALKGHWLLVKRWKFPFLKIISVWIRMLFDIIVKGFTLKFTFRKTN